VFSWLRRATPEHETAHKLYGAVVAGARDPWFYRDCGVPDTPQGRFEMLVLHTFLLAERVRRIPGSEAVERHLVEAFVTDFDDNMREMGVGDVVVHRKVKKATAGLFERSLDYRAALATSSDMALAGKLGEHIQGLDTAPEIAARLAAEIRARASRLAAAADIEIAAGNVTFAGMVEPR
jgi:cytochrome b pre-mRNA-processing protein 3